HLIEPFEFTPPANAPQFAVFDYDLIDRGLQLDLSAKLGDALRHCIQEHLRPALDVACLFSEQVLTRQGNALDARANPSGRELVLELVEFEVEQVSPKEVVGAV